MTYPIAYLLPVLMLLDYYLTLLGFTLYQRYYEKHVEMERYELNPSFQACIKAKKYYSLRHLGFVLLMLAMAIAINYSFKKRDAFIDGILGALFTVYSIVIGSHIASILTFRKISKNPESITGHVRMNYLLTLRMSQCRLIIPLMVLVVAVIVSPSPALIGALAGVAGFYLVLGRWHFVHLRKLRTELVTKAGSEQLKETRFSKFLRITFAVVQYTAVGILVLLAITTGFFRGYFILAVILTLVLLPVVFLAATLFFRRRRAFAVLLAAFVEFAAINFFTLDLTHIRLEAEGDKVVHAINEYNLKNGHFPESLDELDLPQLTRRYGGWLYESSQNGDNFILEIGNYELYRFVLW
jgi:hypothetical protein